MKIVWVALYLLNSSGGSPVKVAELQSMEQCARSIADTRTSNKKGYLETMICVPIYAPE